MSKQAVALIAGLLVIGLLVAGCGDDTEASTISKAVFVKKANAICKESLDKISSDVSAAFRNSDDGGAPSNLNEELVESSYVPTLEQEVEEIRALGVPSGDEDQVAEILEAVEGVIEEIESSPEGLSEEKKAEAEEPATRYGLSACPLG